jgi:hypothetical protein
LKTIKNLAEAKKCTIYIIGVGKNKRSILLYIPKRPTQNSKVNKSLIGITFRYNYLHGGLAHTCITSAPEYKNV